MTVVSVPKNVWTSVTTASADTIIENLGQPEVFISTSPSFADPKKLTITTVQPGQTAYIYSVNKDTTVNVLNEMFDIGTVSAPSVRPESDPNTGVNFLGSDQIQLVTGGVERVLLNTSAMQVSVPITGTAVTQSQTDTTTGRLIKVGDYGLGPGQTSFSSDIDTLVATGFYRLATGAFSTASPTPALSNGDIVSHFYWDTNTSYQVLHKLASGGRMYFRRKSTTWSAWAEFVDLATSQTLTNKTLTAPVINTSITGTAVTQTSADSTAGRLMKVGDFGLGTTTTPDVDANASDLATRIFRSTTAASNPGAAGTWHVAHISRAANANGAQIAIADTNIANAPRIAVRHRGGSVTWSQWHELYGRLNILGTVSQSGGTPTGAVIEQGSNANGRYVRWADGTQICYATIDQLLNNWTTANGAFFFGTSTWTYPAVFSSVLAVINDVQIGDDRITGARNRGTPNNNSVIVELWANTSAASGLQKYSYHVAIGRWF